MQKQFFNDLLMKQGTEEYTANGQKTWYLCSQTAHKVICTSKNKSHLISEWEIQSLLTIRYSI